MDVKTLDVCICVLNRPDALHRCLQSVERGEVQPATVWVSDDSSDPALASEIQRVCQSHHGVQYRVGPKRGLCANRNAVVALSKAGFVSLLDDDAVVGCDFIRRATDLIQTLDDRTIVTGDVLENGSQRQSPTNPTFLGHFGRHLRPGEKLANVNLNCNIFPRSAFMAAKFDERIGFGYEDTDLCAQLLRAGCSISHVADLVNEHWPPARGSYRNDSHKWSVERARFYTSLRRYGRWQPSLRMTVAFALIAPVHLALHALRERQFFRVASGWVWVGRDLLRLGA